MSTIERESFVFYRSFSEALDCLPAEEYKATMQALCAYAMDGNEVEVSGITKALLALMKPQIDANQRRYENGKKGGAPKKEPKDNQTEPNRNQRTTKQEPNRNQEEPNDNHETTNPEPNANANVNVNVNANVNENTPPSPPSGEFGGPGGSGECEEAQEVEYPGVKPSINVKEFWARWSKVPGQPDAGGLLRFNTVTWRKVYENTTGLDPGDVYKAVENYALLRATPGNTWQTNPTSDKWTRDHIGRFMPGTFNLEDYLEKKPPGKASTEWDRIISEIHGQGEASGRSRV